MVSQIQSGLSMGISGLGGRCMFFAAEVGGNSWPHNDGAGHHAGIIHVHAINTTEYVEALDLVPPPAQDHLILSNNGICPLGRPVYHLEATGRMTVAEVRGPGGNLGGTALHRLAGVAPPGPCSHMNAGKHHLKYLVGKLSICILHSKSIIRLDMYLGTCYCPLSTRCWSSQKSCPPKRRRLVTMVYRTPSRLHTSTAGPA